MFFDALRNERTRTFTLLFSFALFLWYQHFSYVSEKKETVSDMLVRTMAGARNGVLHPYASRLAAFEYIPKPTLPPSQNLIIFIGGLFDGLLTVPYPATLSEALPPTWGIAQVLLSSSYNGWGTSSLQRDVKELSKAVAYFRALKPGKIILMGHSTGCQDVMEYFTGKGHEDREPIDAGIIQAPVSDREAILMSTKQADYDETCKKAQEMVDAGQGDEILPGKQSPCPVTAKRWLSVASPNHDGDDDYFSSDLKDEQLMKSFGALPAGRPLCIIYSGADEHVPKSIDKQAMVDRWIGFVKMGKGTVDEVNSGVLEGASHNLEKNDDVVVQGLVKRVLGFVNGL